MRGGSAGRRWRGRWLPPDLGRGQSAAERSRRRCRGATRRGQMGRRARIGRPVRESAQGARVRRACRCGSACFEDRPWDLGPWRVAGCGRDEAGRRRICRKGFLLIWKKLGMRWAEFGRWSNGVSRWRTVAFSCTEGLLQHPRSRDSMAVIYARDFTAERSDAQYYERCGSTRPESRNNRRR